MSRFFRRLCIVCACCAALLSCDESSAKELTVGEVAVFSFEGNATTGFSWQLVDVEKQNVVELVSQSYTPNKSPAEFVGVGGVFEFAVKAVKPGKATLKLIYSRQWESVPPIDEKEIKIIVR